MSCQLLTRIVLVAGLLGVTTMSGCASKGQEHNYKELNRDRPRFETEPEYNTYQHYGYADPILGFMVYAQVGAMQNEREGNAEQRADREEADVGEPGGVVELKTEGGRGDQLGIPAQSRVVGRSGEAREAEQSEEPTEEDDSQKSADELREEVESNAAPYPMSSTELDEQQEKTGEVKPQAGPQNQRGIWGRLDRLFNPKREVDEVEKIDRETDRDEVQTEDQATKRELEIEEGIVPGEEVPHGGRVLREGWALPSEGPMEDWTQETTRGNLWARQNERIEEGAAVEAEKNSGYVPTPPELDTANREKIVEFEKEVAEGKINPEENPYFDNQPQPLDVLEDDTARTAKREAPSGTNFPGDTSGTDILWPEEMDSNMRRLRRENWPRIQFAPVDGRTVHLPTYRFGQIPLGADSRDPLDADTVQEQMSLAMSDYKQQGWNDLNWQNVPASFFRSLSLIATMPIRCVFIDSPFEHVRTAKISYQQTSESPEAVLFDPQDFSNTLPGATVLKKGEVDNPMDPLVPLNETYVREQMIEMGKMGEMERFGEEKESAKELEEEDGF